MAFKSLFFLICFSAFFTENGEACSLEKKIVSLSGPITMLLEELGLLEDRKLAAISNFHPIQSKTSAEVLKGGLFLSFRKLRNYKGHTFFVDKSVEFEKLLRKSDIKESIVVDSRGMGAVKATELSLKKISPQLKGCEKKIVKIQMRLLSLKEKLKQTSLNNLIFYLGSLKIKKPDYIMARDGFVLDLINYSHLETFQSKLHYVLWSQKELRNYSDYIEVGVVQEMKQKSLVMREYSKFKYDLSYPGVLIPGMSQVKFLEALIASKHFTGKP